MHMLRVVMSGKLTDQEKAMFRAIRIHKILGVRDTGRRISMRCPIHMGHNDQAFHLYPDNSYHCFNCGAHGRGAIDFVMELDGCSFDKAIEQLCDYAL